MERKQRHSGDNFLLQGSILAAAGILVRLIGLLYKIPMTRILGDEGIGYYNTAYEIYNIGLILSSYSLPLAVSKLIAGKEQEGRREDAKKVFHCGIFRGSGDRRTDEPVSHRLFRLDCGGDFQQSWKRAFPSG